MSGRRQIVIKIYPGRDNPFHEKVRARVAELQSEFGMSESGAAMHLLLHQVLDDAEKKMAGLVPRIQPAAAYNAAAASTSDRIQTGTASPPNQTAYCGDGTAIIPESTVDRILRDAGTDATVLENKLPDSITQSAEDSLSRRMRWSSLGRTSKSEGND